MFRNLCFCGDTIGKYGIKSDSECNGNCTGNMHEKCGGVWRNSVYQTNVNTSNKLLKNNILINNNFILTLLLLLKIKQN